MHNKNRESEDKGLEGEWYIGWKERALSQSHSLLSQPVKCGVKGQRVGKSFFFISHVNRVNWNGKEYRREVVCKAR